MKPACQTLSLIAILLLTSSALAQEPSIFFGLPHSPLGGANVTMSYGSLYVTPGDETPAEGEFGVSVALGEADSGIWGQLSTSGSFWNSGNYMVGHAYGQFNGVPNMEIGSLRAETLDWNGPYAVSADFSPLGSFSVTYQVFNGDRPVAAVSNAIDAVLVYAFNETGPSANPFCKMPDGTLAAVIKFNNLLSIQLPGEDLEPVEGDRILIRPEGVSGSVDFASRVDLWAGGGEDTIMVSQERLGIFSRGHKALGESILQAIGGALTIARQENAEDLGAEIGVSVELDALRQFSIQVRPVELLTSDGTLLISAIGTRGGQAGEFLGYAGVQNQAGTLQAFGDFSPYANQLQVGIYRDDCLVGSRICPAPSARVPLSGTPRITRLATTADTGPVNAGFGIRFDQITTFVLPDLSTLAGDEIRFQVANATSVERLSASSLTFSNLPAVTIIGETGPQTINLVDYFPEVIAPALVKEFAGLDNGEQGAFMRSVVWSNGNHRPIAIITDRYADTRALSATYTFQEDGLHFHGYAQPAEELASTLGLRVLPGEITLGQSYFSMGSFDWRETSSGLTYPVGISSLTTVAALETLNLQPGAFSVVRLETVTSVAGAGQAPTNWSSTHWLAKGVGVVKFTETEALADGTTRTRSGELLDYAIVNTPMRTHVGNVGANVVLSADVSAPGTPWIAWRKNGEDMEQAGFGNSRLILNNVQENAAGIYSVQVALGDKLDALVSDIAAVRVIPFSDTPPFWATSIGTDWSVFASALATDNAGNVYLAGFFKNNLTWGNLNYTNRGNEDVYIIKVLPSGQIAWIRTAGGSYSDTVRSLATDASGNVYVAGTFVGSATFGSFQLNSPPPARVDPMFVAKLDANGNFLWAVANGGGANTYCTGMAMDLAGSLYVIGGFSSGTAVFGSTSLTNPYSTADLFFTKLNAQGQFLWARQISDESSDLFGGASTCGEDLTVDNSGNIYVAGRFGEQITFDGTTLRSGQPSWIGGGFLAKADPNGHFLWAKVVGQDVRAITADLLGNIYVTGGFVGLTRIDGVLLASRNNWTDYYLAQVGSDGVLGWARLSPQQPNYYTTPLATDNQGNLYVAGSFYNEAGYDGTTFSQSYNSSTVLSKLDSSGRSLWHKQMPGSGYNLPRSMARDHSGNVYLAGEFQTQIAFGDINLTASRPANVYLVKITGATAPSLTLQPQPQTVNLGEAVSFSVAAAGTEPLSYQWRKDGRDIPGAASSSYTLAGAALEDAGGYAVLVKNAGGIVISATAALEVIAPDAGTFAFGEPNYAIDESNAWLSVTIIRTGNTAIAANVELITRDGTAEAGEDFWTSALSLQFAAGETSKTVLVPIIDDWPWEPTETFILRLCRPGPGAVIAQQDTATVTITDNDLPGAPVILVQPASLAVRVGQSVAFGVVAEGTQPMSYQWRKDGADLADGTSRTFTITEAHLADAGSYSVIVRNDGGQVTSADALLTVLPPPDVHYVIFGLTNRPLGQVHIATNNGYLEITPRHNDEEEFGVSVTLGEADSGVFGSLATGGSFQGEGNYIAGYVYGQLNGVPDQFLCSLKATTVDWYSGRFVVEADFSPLDPSGITYQVFDHGKLVASINANGPFYICDYSEFSPAANPFMRLPDGTIAAVIQLSGSRGIQYDEGYITGDRILIRAENTAGLVDFASRVDVKAGGGEDLILINQERLGMFNRSHLALGDSIFKAISGQLTVAPLHSPQALPGEIGTSIALEDTRQFKLQLQPQDLAEPGASLMASAVGKYKDQTTDFLGYAALQNNDGGLQITGDLPCSPAGIQVIVYRGGSPIGTVPIASHSATVSLTGAPLALNFEAAADNGLTPPWLAVQLDRETTFLLPDGSSLQGDQIRFRAANTVPMDRLYAFSLTASNLAEFTITAESGYQPVTLAEYVPEVLMPRFLKKFSGATDGAAAHFLRMSTRTNLDGRPLVLITDLVGPEISSVSYSAQQGGVRWHGAAWGAQKLSSGPGLLLLPDEIVVGQTYIGQGTFEWQNEASGEQAILEVRAVSSLNWETVNSPVGISSVLRLETVMAFSGSQSTTAPATWRATNWLAPGVGVVKFAETMTDAAGQTHHRSGELTDCAILKTAPYAAVGNVGANIVLPIETVLLGQARVIEWQQDGVASEGGTDRFYLNELNPSHAGLYSVVLGILNDNELEMSAVCDIATVRVIPFSDTPPFWAAQLTSSYTIDAAATALDAAGNIYVAGCFRGTLYCGSSAITNQGNEDVFLAKFNSAGQLLWARTAGGAYNDYAAGLKLDAAGNVYLSGTFLGTATFGSTQLVAPPPAQYDPVFVTKVDPNGNFLWAVANGGNSTVTCKGLAMDPSGNLYVLGSFFNGTLTFGNISLTNRLWESHLFLAKLNNQGQWLWAIQTSGYTSPAAAVADSAGNVYLCGMFYPPATFGQISLSAPASSSTGFLTKVDPNGNFIWAKTIGAFAHNLTIDSADNIFVVGEFYGVANFEGVWLSSRTTSADSYLAKFGPDGVQQWAKLSPQQLSYDGMPLVTDSSDNVYLAGNFYGETTCEGTTFFQRAYSSTILSKLDPSGRSLWNKQVTGNGDNWPRSLARDNAGNVYLAGDFHNQVLFGNTRVISSYAGNIFLVKITGATGPVLTQQPQSRKINPGEPASFTVSATGTEPLSFQWRKNGQDIAGAASASYTLASAAAADAGVYSVMVKNAGGIVISDNATLEVVAADAGTILLSAAEYSVAETDPFVLVTVLRTGGASSAATVELRTADDTAIAGLDYVATAVSLRFAPGETTKTAAIPILDNGEWEPTETFGLRLCSADPGVTLGQPALALVRILDNDLPGAPVIRVQPSSHQITQGGAVSFFVTAVGDAPLSYQWRKDGLPLTGATNRIFTIAAAQTSDAGVYSVVVRNNVAEITSADATLIVLIPPSIITPLQNQTIARGESVSLTIAAQSTPAAAANTVMPPPATGESLTYSWRKDGTLIAGATGPTLTINPVNFTDEGIYTVIITDQNGATTSSSATLSVLGPILRIASVAGQLQFSWNAPEYHLEVTDDPIHGTWQDVQDAFSGMTLPGAYAQDFFRLHQSDQAD